MRIKVNEDQTMWNEKNIRDYEILQYNTRIREIFICRLKRAINEYNFNFKNIANEGIQQEPPWDTKKISRCNEPD